MIHPTYRRLDEPPKLAGFSMLQWLALILLAVAVWGVLRLIALPTQPAVSVFTLLVGGPAALLYFSESGRPSLLRLARDAARWITRPRVHQPGPGQPRPVQIRPEKPVREHRRRERRRRRTGSDRASL